MEPRRIAYETARLRLARYRVEGAHARTAAAEHATWVSAEALSVERAGVWLFGEQRRRLVCVTMLTRSRRERNSGQVLEATSCPLYFEALTERRVIAADDARTHPHLGELEQAYLRPLDVASLISAPIIRDGHAVGVVCLEHVGAPRAWTEPELEFASAVADALALSFEQAQRLELEAALQEQTEQRLEAQRMEALGRIACAVAHDFNNLLGALSLTVGAASYGVTGGPLRELTGEIEHIIAAGRGLTGQLLAFGRPPTEGIGYADLRAVVEHMLPMLRTALGRAIGLEVDLGGTLDARVSGDAAQLEQVLLNLVLNARDAIDAKTGRVWITLRSAEVDDEAPVGALVLEVRDNGVGMDEATRARIFEPYFTTKNRGTGLGLATVYGIVRRAGGIVRCKSEPSRGTTMQVALPAAAP